MCVADCFDEACGVAEVKRVGSEAGLRDMVGEDCLSTYENRTTWDGLDALNFELWWSESRAAIELFWALCSFRLVGLWKELLPTQLPSPSRQLNNYQLSPLLRICRI